MSTARVQTASPRDSARSVRAAPLITVVWSRDHQGAPFPLTFRLAHGLRTSRRRHEVGLPSFLAHVDMLIDRRRVAGLPEAGLNESRGVGARIEAPPSRVGVTQDVEGAARGERKAGDFLRSSEDRIE